MTLSDELKERKEQLSYFLRELAIERKTAIVVNDRKGRKFPIAVDWRIIPNCKADSFSVPVTLVTGYLSGYEGILPLAFSLFRKGLTIILVSIPGCGQSDNLPWFYIGKGADYFINTAGIIADFLRTINIRKTDFVGHSMGGQIGGMFAAHYPEIIRKLGLISPSGFKRYRFYSQPGLVWRSISSGMRLREEYEKFFQASGEEYSLQPLVNLANQQKSPIGWGRILQRLAEFHAICSGNMVECMRWIDSGIPVAYISGTKDTVFPPSEFLPIVIRAAKHLNNFEYIRLPGIGHNPTLYNTEATAAAIAHFLEE